MFQIIEEDVEVNKKSILVELQNLSNERNFKELENLLQNSITKLSNLNKNEFDQPEKTDSKENRKIQDSNNFWNTRLSRAFWIEGLRISECKDSYIRFYPSRATICKS